MKLKQELLFIVPKQHVSPIPVIDYITRKMCGAFRLVSTSDYAYGGVHICNCGAVSSSHDHYLPNGVLTNSLCVHYVAHHRVEVPQWELAKIEEFMVEEVEPTWQELHDPQPILPAFPAEVQRAVDGLEAQIETLYQEFNEAIAKGDWKRAAQIWAQTRDQINELENKKKNIIRQWRIKYLVEHFNAIGDLWIKMRWGVILLDDEAASSKIVEFLETALESMELANTLSYRLGLSFDGFMKRLKAYEARPH